MRRVGSGLPFEIRAWLAAAAAVLIFSLAVPTLISHFRSQPRIEAPPRATAPAPAPEASLPKQPSQSVNRSSKAAREAGALRDARAADDKAAAKMKKSAGKAGRVQTGRASWYNFTSATASGEKMDGEALTAAHRTLPLGTMVVVENLDNGRSVKVRINDRGPFAGKRIIDVSKAAAEELDMVADGVANVRVSPIPEVVTAGRDRGALSF